MPGNESTKAVILKQNKNQEPKVTRDKDNASPRIKPPSLAANPGPRLAPPGTTGTKRNLPAPEKTTAAKPKPFRLGKKGDLAKKFKPVVSVQSGKGVDISKSLTRNSVRHNNTLRGAGL